MGTNNNASSSGISINTVEMPVIIVSGRVVTAAGWPTVLDTDTTRELTGVQIKALPGNAGTVYLGTSSVTTSNGYQLEASNELFVNVSTLANLYIDVSDDGEGIVYYAQVKTVPAPMVAGITPASGSDGGGTAVTIAGTNFIGVTAVTIGGTTCTSIITASDISITAVTSASGTTGAKDVVVTTAYGTGTLAGGFTYT